MSTLPERVHKLCQLREWKTDWSSLGCYLHLEVSELIESLRGKGSSTPLQESADVLLVLMAITQANGIGWADVLAEVERIVSEKSTVSPLVKPELQMQRHYSFGDRVRQGDRLDYMTVASFDPLVLVSPLGNVILLEKDVDVSVLSRCGVATWEELSSAISRLSSIPRTEWPWTMEVKMRIIEDLDLLVKSFAA